jgi:phosphate-selective porin OprO/OprP
MAKHEFGFVIRTTALAACFAVLAQAVCPLTQGQEPTEPRAPDAQPPATAPTEPAEAPAAPEIAPAFEARLKSIESQLQKLLDVDEGKVTIPAPRPSVQVGGQVQMDAILIGQNAANRSTVGEAQNIYDFRRARITARGEVFDVIEYSAGFDFAQAGRPTFLDNWIAARELPILGNLRFGHFFEPFSLERFNSNRNGTFMERSLADAFAPARNLGVMAHDTIGEDELGTWFVGLFRSNSNNFGDDFSNVGGNALTARMTRLLYYDQDGGGRSFLHVGGAYSFRSEDQHVVEFQSFPEARDGTPGALGIPAFAATGPIAALNDQRFGTEFSMVYGPLYMQAEYMCSTVNQIGGPQLFFQGAYAYASFFLTGENRTYNKRLGVPDRVYPFENFFRVRTGDGPATGWGAWEVAVRWSFIDLNNRNIQGGNLNDITLGLNWHLNPYTRMRWEYIHAQLNRAPVGESFAQMAGMRVDMDF